MPAARDWEDTIRAVVFQALSQKWRRCLLRGTGKSWSLLSGSTSWSVARSSRPP